MSELLTYFAWMIPTTCLGLALIGWGRHVHERIKRQTALAEDHTVSLSEALDRIKDRCDVVAATPVLPVLRSVDPYRQPSGPLRLRCPHCSLPVDVELAVPGEVPARVGGE